MLQNKEELLKDKLSIGFTTSECHNPILIVLFGSMSWLGVYEILKVVGVPYYTPLQEIVSVTRNQFLRPVNTSGDFLLSGFVGGYQSRQS